MEVLFRKANIDDVKGIIDLCNECFDEDTSVDYAIEKFKETENDPNQIYLIGIVEGKIVAHTKITIITTMYKNMEKYVILNHVCVKPDYRRHNIATKMLNECERICRDNDCISMKLWSNNFREAAHAFYKKYGFVVNDAKFFSKEI